MPRHLLDSIHDSVLLKVKAAIDTAGRTHLGLESVIQEAKLVESMALYKSNIPTVWRTRYDDAISTDELRWNLYF